MTTKQKNELIAAVTALLEKMIPVEDESPAITVSEPALPEMLTIKECAELVSGLTEHTVRMLVKQDKVKYIRCGQGARGKILVSKDSLLKYLALSAHKKNRAMPDTAREGGARPKGVQRNAAAKAFVAPFRSDKSIFALIVSNPSCGNTIPQRKEKCILRERSAVESTRAASVTTIVSSLPRMSIRAARMKI